MAALHGYFDDSGTHKNSAIVVWGGIVGPENEIVQIERAWTALLLEPVEGKGAIDRFGAAHCANAWGEFENYSPAERDRARWRFRDVIVQADVAPVAFIVSVKDWNRIFTKKERRYLGDAATKAFSGCLQLALSSLSRNQGPVSFHFDQGQFGIAINTAIEAWRMFNPDAAERAQFSFSSVASTPALQAADTIAYEAYQHGMHVLDPEQYPESPHFRDLTSRLGAAFFLLGEPEIAEHARLNRHWLTPLISSLDE